MKTRILALAAILALLAIVGVAAAQSLDAEINAPAVRCFNSNESCNDYKFVVNQPLPGYLTLNGYEYGCGFNDRLATGSGHIVGNTLYVGFSVNGPKIDANNGPRLGDISGAIDRTTGAITDREYAYNYESYHWGTGTGTWGPCTKEGPTGGPDESR